jgi:hypothetical protein
MAVAVARCGTLTASREDVPAFGEWVAFGPRDFAAGSYATADFALPNVDNGPEVTSQHYDDKDDPDERRTL